MLTLLDVCLLSSGTSLLGGVSVYLSAKRTREEFTAAGLVSTVLGSAVLGLGLAMLLWQWFGQTEDGRTTIVGICAFAGLGLIPVRELATKLIPGGLVNGGNGKAQRRREPDSDVVL